MADDTVELRLAQEFAIRSQENEQVTGVAFKMKDGDIIGALIKNEDLGRLAALILIEAQRFAATHLRESKSEETLTAVPIPVEALGVGQGRTRTEGLLVVHLGNLSLTFAVELSTLHEMCELLSETTETTEKPRPN